MKTICIIQARLNSSRFPDKIIKKIFGDFTVIEFLIQRLLKSQEINKIIVATTTNKKDNLLVDLLREIPEVEIFRGSENDVLERVADCALMHSGDTLIEITSDCPFIDIAMLDKMVNCFHEYNYDYISNALIRGWPDGFDIQIYRSNVIRSIAKCQIPPEHRSHGGWNILNYSDKLQNDAFENLKIGNYHAPIKYFKPDLRLTLDYPEDLELMKEIVSAIGEVDFGIEDIFNILESEPELLEINKIRESKIPGTDKIEGGE